MAAHSGITTFCHLHIYLFCCTGCAVFFHSYDGFWIEFHNFCKNTVAKRQNYDYDLIQGRGKACIPDHIQINYNNNYCS